MAAHRQAKRPGKKRKTPAKPAFSDEDGERWLASIRQVTLLRILHTAAKVVLEREQKGMPRNGDGTYDLFAVTDWLKKRGNGIYEKPPKSMTPGETGDPKSQENYEALLTKYKALEQQAKYNERIGDVMPKIEAERIYLQIVTQLRASLLAQSEVLAPQLANLGPREVAKLLDARFRWMCRTFEDGWVPLPEEAIKAIDDLVAKISTTPTAPPVTEPAA